MAPTPLLGCLTFGREWDKVKQMFAKDEVAGGEIEGLCNRVLIDPFGVLDRCRRLADHCKGEPCDGGHSSFSVEDEALTIMKRADPHETGMALRQIRSIQQMRRQ